jgi:DNA-binding response OmpR family regulator
MYRTVLCLTDCDEASEMLRDRLGPGCRLIVASTILGALSQLRKFTPDLIFVQICLKEESCFDFLRVAQLVTEPKKIPMIAANVKDVLHESTESFIRRTCLFFGCRQYLTEQDFHSDGLRFQITQLMRTGALDKTAC